MNCYKCSGEMRSRRANVPGEYAGEKLVVNTEAMVCSGCGYTTLHASQIDAFTTKLADAHRAKHGLLTSGQIRAVRTRLGMSQEEFAKYLNVGVASVKRWELGKAQDKSSDELIRLKSNEARAKENVAVILFNQGGEADEFSGDRCFSIIKLGQVALFFLQQAAGKRILIGPLHINKLCWYADAENYRHHRVSITGTRYARLPWGPVIDDYRMVFRELQRRGIIAAHGVDRLEPLQPFQPDGFRPEELKTLESVWNRFKGRLRQIVDDSHQEKAWRETEHAELISFKLLN